MSTADPLAAVHRYIAAFNNGDVAEMASAFDSAATILDGLAPHVWQGASAAQDWYRDVIAESAHLGASDYVVGVGVPLHNSVSDDRAYLVLPATMTFSLRGAQVRQDGAFFTVALRRASQDWRITAWAWTRGTQRQ
ncbi:hypothetical protein AU197_15955 [Mycobacterium sp. IS-1590]|uniref:nuclear transport factor 2 family protein n=1 Tax=Mycobacterium sp. IS-1590 TaxID=1772286 RepID=UPI000746B281|nr:nuclear transport factor 2 family protein [Mycobacterium sp. IS-1590]KUI42734.1 hypothetical protein AU197_15955 [Mycobacterium sp. IS-1590]